MLLRKGNANVYAGYYWPGGKANEERGPRSFKRLGPGSSKAAKAELLSRPLLRTAPFRVPTG